MLRWLTNNALVLSMFIGVLQLSDGEQLPGQEIGVLEEFVPNERGLDVDSPFDWDVIEYLLGKQIADRLRAPA